MSKITDVTFTSRQEANFAYIMNRIHTQNPDMGGCFTEATGMQGASKTAAMLSFADHNMIVHPDQRNFWRNTYETPLQVTKLPYGSWEILVEEGHNVTFHERTKGLPEVDLPYDTFKSFEDLYETATPGKTSVLFFKDETFWMNLIHYLGYTGEWNHVFLDEYAELFPINPRGKLHRKIGEAANDLGEIRKRNINVHATTHAAAEIDWRIRRKIMIYIYFPWSKVVSDSLVKQEAVNKLELNLQKGNEAWMELRGHRYGKGRYTKIYRPDPEMDWMAMRPDDAVTVSDYLVKDDFKQQRNRRRQVAPPVSSPDRLNSDLGN